MIGKEQTIASGNYEEAIYDGICCHYITVNTEITPDCCVKFRIHNPNCSDTVFVHLAVYNSNTGRYDNKHIAKSYRNFIVYTICPENYGNVLNYRIRIAGYNNEPYCIGPGYETWTEGLTQYSGIIDLNSCCDCPINPVSNDWFTMTLKADPSCPDSSCLVQNRLNIPDSITCFAFYEYDDPIRNIYSSGTILPNFISQFDGCLHYGATTEALLTLKRSPTDNNPCILVARASCDTNSYKIKNKEPCTPDCKNTPFEYFHKLKGYTISGCQGCSVNVNYTWRFACNYYQDLQILDIQFLSPECNNCNLNSIYKQALAKIIWDNEMNFSPEKNTNDSCSTIWRIVQAGCWAYWSLIIHYFDNPISNSLPTGYWELCDTSDCCIQPLTVCRYNWGIRIIPEQVFNYLDSCNNVWTVNKRGDTLNCEPRCDWLVNLGGDYLFYQFPIISFEQNGTGNKNFLFSGINISIKYYNTDSEFYVIIDSYIESDIIIQIRDLLGKEILDYKAQIYKGPNHKIINISALKTGVYFFIIRTERSNIYTGKFFVIR